MKRYLTYLLCALVGAVGFVSSWSAWHLYQDHVTLHEVVKFLSQRPAMSPGK